MLPQVPVNVNSVTNSILASGNETTCDPSNIAMTSPPNIGGATSYTYQWYAQAGLQTCPSSTTGWTLVSTANVSAQQIINENFGTTATAANVVTGWTVTKVLDADNDNNLSLVTAGANPAPAGAGAYVMLNSNVGDNTDAYLLSRMVSTVGYFNISVSYKWYEQTSGSSDQLECLYNTGSGWTVAQSHSRVGGNNVWSTKTYSLPAAANNNASFQIGFRFTNGTNNLAPRNSYLDDVILTGIPMAAYNPPVITTNTTYALLVTSNNGTCAGTSLWATQCRQVTACALPVEWLDFYAKAQAHDNQLLWQTANEINHSHFVTEKSMDGISFTAFGQLNSKGNNYSFTDENPWKNTYYRIKQVDFDGQFSYSNVILVEREQTEYNYSFDQVSQTLIIDLPENHNINLDLIDIQGKKMMDFESLTNGKNQFYLNISPGIYFLQWIEQGKQIKLERIMIMK